MSRLWSSCGLRYCGGSRREKDGVRLGHRMRSSLISMGMMNQQCRAKQKQESKKRMRCSLHSGQANASQFAGWHKAVWHVFNSKGRNVDFSQHVFLPIVNYAIKHLHLTHPSPSKKLSRDTLFEILISLINGSDLCHDNCQQGVWSKVHMV